MHCPKTTSEEDKMAQFYPYFGNSLHQAEVIELYETIRDSNLLDDQNKIKINDKIQASKDGKKTWREVIIKGFKDRIIPEFTIDDVNQMNQLHTAEVTKINREKSNKVEGWKNIVKSTNNRLEDLATMTTKDTLAAAEVRAILTSKIRMLNQHIQLAVNAGNQSEQRKLVKEKDLLECDLRMKIHECNLRVAEYKRQMAILQQKKQDVSHEIEIMEFLPSPETINKNLILHSHNIVKGWIPSKQSYTMLRNTRTPPDAEIFKNISFEPETNQTNLPLTISKLITFSELIGADDKCLLAIILQFMNKYKKDLMNTFEPKKHSLYSMIYAIADQCSTAQEKMTVLREMKSFYRREDESFASSLNRFDSMYLFYLQLDRPQPPDELKHLSYQVVLSLTQFIIAEKCAQVYSSWQRIQRQKGIIPSKEEIIRIISELEESADLKPKTALRLAPQVIATLLHIPSEAQQIDCAAASISNEGRKSRSRSRENRRIDASQSNTRPSSRNNNYGNRPPTPKGNTSPSPSTPSRPKPISHNGRKSPITPSTRPRDKSPFKDNEHWRKQFYSLQFPPFTKSENRVNHNEAEWKSIEDRYQNKHSTQQIHEKGFPVRNSEKFKDVREKNRCLRCYGQHKSTQCTKFKVRTPTPCRYCRYLYHPTEMCHKYNDKGHTRPSTPQPEH